MGNISKSCIEDLDLTIFRVEGALTSDMVMSQLEEFYLDGDPTRHILWDLSLGEITTITQAEMGRILDLAQAHAHRRRNGRTALVGSHDLAFGLARMYEILAEVGEHPLEHRVTRDLDTALAWITRAPGRKEGEA